MRKQLVDYLKHIPFHLLFWFLVWLFYVYFFNYTATNQSFVLWFSTSILPITIITTYLFSYLIVPKYLMPKKYWLFTLYAAYIFICSLFLVLIITFINYILLSDFNMDEMPVLTRNFVFVMIMVYLVVGLVSFVRLLHSNFKTVNRNKELENKLLAGKLLLKQKELQYLKQQIHPHFLFNTLNTIYGFALKKSEETPELILKLSNLLDYILHQIDKPTVMLSEEVKYIESYIGLEKVRFRDTLRVHFEKDIQTDLQVPPMLFMAFVENAFKHGSVMDGFLSVDIHLKADAEILQFEISNTVKGDRDHTGSHGLGIENIRKRLDAQYPNLYMLKMTENNDRYHVKLDINKR